jgi:hypothetical protein
MANDPSLPLFAKVRVLRSVWRIPLPPQEAKAVPLRNGGRGGLPDSMVCELCDISGGRSEVLIVSGRGIRRLQDLSHYPNQCSHKTRCVTGVFGTSAGYVIY